MTAKKSAKAAESKAIGSGKPMRIDKLTPEQQSRFKEWTNKWVEIGLSTEPADFDAATEAALKAYQLCNLKKPMVVLRVGSPYAATVGGALAWQMLRGIAPAQVGDQVRDQVWAQVWAQVRAQVWAQVWAQVGDQVWDQVWDQVGAQVWDQVWDQVGAQVWAQVRDQVGDQVRAQVWDQVGAQVRDQVGAQVGDQVWAESFKAAKDGLYNEGASNISWAGFTSWVSYFRDVCGWEDEVLGKFEVTEALVKSCGWTWWHKNVLAISDRPKSIHRDEEGRLHCEGGPSIEYRDGWALYHWHGVSIPREWVTGQPPNANEALKWPNIEQRRAAVEIVGWSNVLRELKPKTIDRDSDPEVGELIEVNLPDSEAERFLVVQCGTGRKGITIPVPREMKTALQAGAWTYGLDTLSYKPEVRT
jgi:hypothetical protein